MKRRTLLQFGSAAAASTVAWPALAQERTKIAYGYSAVSDFATVFVATDEGFFAKRGLDVEPKFIPLNPTIILLSGQQRSRGIELTGTGKIVGNWYVRLRHLFVPGIGGDSNSDRLLARYYYKGDADNYVEFAAGAGWSDTALLGAAGLSGQGHSWSTSAAFVKFLSPRLGFKLGALLERDEYGYDGHGVFGSIYTRW